MIGFDSNRARSQLAPDGPSTSRSSIIRVESGRCRTRPAWFSSARFRHPWPRPLCGQRHLFHVVSRRGGMSHSKARPTHDEDGIGAALAQQCAGLEGGLPGADDRNSATGELREIGVRGGVGDQIGSGGQVGELRWHVRVRPVTGCDHDAGRFEPVSCVQVELELGVVASNPRHDRIVVHAGDEPLLEPHAVVDELAQGHAAVPCEQRLSRRGEELDDARVGSRRRDARRIPARLQQHARWHALTPRRHGRTQNRDVEAARDKVGRGRETVGTRPDDDYRARTIDHAPHPVPCVDRAPAVPGPTLDASGLPESHRPFPAGSRTALYRALAP